MTARHENQKQHRAKTQDQEKFPEANLQTRDVAAKGTPPEHTFDGGIFDGGVFGVCPADDKD